MRKLSGRIVTAAVLIICIMALPVPGAIPQVIPARLATRSLVLPSLLVAQAPQPTPSPTPTPQPTERPQPTPTPTTTPVPSPAPQPSPTPSPSPGPQQPTPTPTPQQVAAVEIRGNNRVPTDQILAAVQTKVGEQVNDERIRADVRAILDLGSFTDVTARLERADDGARVVFIVIENPVVSEIIIEGNTVISTEEIRTALGIPIGEILNLNKMREGARAVEKLYESKGFVLARVTDIGIIPSDGGGGRLRVRVGEGRIETIRFSGLRKTREAVVRRHLTLKQGDVFNLTQLNRDLQRIFELGLFESVRAQPQPGTTADSAVIVIEVKEARTGQIGFGVGYSTVDGLLGFLEFRDRNWQGLGQTFAVRLERGIQSGSSAFNYEITLTEPFLDAQRDSLDLSVFARTSIESEYSGSVVSSRFQLQRTGAFAQVTRPLDPTTSLALRLRSELTTITALRIDPTDTTSCSQAPPCALPSLLTPGRVVSLGITATRDTRNDRFAPTAGSRIVLGTDVALQALGGDFSFTKYTADYQRFFPLGPGAIVFRMAGGIAMGTLPLQEQFLLGGPSTVRSYPAARFRGDSIIVTNLEYRFPLSVLFQALGDIQGIVFVDAGEYRLSPGPFSDPKLGYGFGVAVKTPVGPLRVDLAFGPEGRQTWLSLGAPF